MDDEISEPQTWPLDQAAERLDSLVRRVADARERIAITDQGQVAAVLISPRELADLEQALAVAEYRALFAGVPVEQRKISEVLGGEVLGREVVGREGEDREAEGRRERDREGEEG
jgi:PHD/YefM family antitoxin component YafN of YafNO toxin-antitoxin module